MLIWLVSLIVWVSLMVSSMLELIHLGLMVPLMLMADSAVVAWLMRILDLLALLLMVF